MNELQNKWKALQSLRQSPYNPRSDESGWLWTDENGVVRSIHLGYTQATLVLPISDLPALLNPIAKEWAEERLLAQLNNWHSCNEWDPPEKVAFVMTLMAHLFPEEAPTDANPMGGDS